MTALIWLEIIGLTLLAAYPIFRAQLRGTRVDYFESINVICLLFWIVSAGRALNLLAFRFDTVYLQTLQDPEPWIALALAMFAVTLVFLQLGYYWKPRNNFFATSPLVEIRGRYGVVLVAIMGVSAGGLLVLTAWVGGIPGLDFTLAQTLEFRGVFWLQLLVQSYFAGLALAACAYFKERRLSYLIATAVLFAAILVLEGGLGSKGGLIGPLLMLLVAYHYLVRPIRAGILALFVVLVLVLVPITYLFREYGFSLAEIRARIGTIDFRTSMLLLDFMNRWYDLDMSAVVYESVRSGKVAHDWFGVARDFFVQVIPSAFWPDKPVGYTIQVLRTFAPGIHSEFTGGVISFPGALYYSFSWVGIPIGAYLFGRALGWSQRRLQANRDVYHVALYGVFLYCVTRYVQGLFSEATIALLGRILPLLILIVALDARATRRGVTRVETELQSA